MEKTYFDKVHTWGRVSCLVSLVFMLCIPLAITLWLDAWPPLAGVLKGLAGVVPLFWATAVIETLSYGPIIGSGGSYLAFVTGNISNLKLPGAISALNGAGVRANTEEGEVISTIAVATSAIVTTVVLALGVLVMTPFLPLITKPDSIIAPAFQQVMPALFGALLAGYLRKHWRVAFMPVLIGVIVLIFAPTLMVGIMIPILVIVSLLFAQLMWKLNVVKHE